MTDPETSEAPVYARASDVPDRWKAGQTAADLERDLANAHELLRSRVPGLNHKVATEQLREGTVKLVLVNMVVRVLRNPHGYRQQAAGEFSYTIDSANSTGDLVLSEADKELLGIAGGEAYTVPLADRALPHVSRPAPRW